MRKATVTDAPLGCLRNGSAGLPSSSPSSLLRLRLSGAAADQISKQMLLVRGLLVVERPGSPLSAGCCCKPVSGAGPSWSSFVARPRPSRSAWCASRTPPPVMVKVLAVLTWLLPGRAVERVRVAAVVVVGCSWSSVAEADRGRRRRRRASRPSPGACVELTCRPLFSPPTLDRLSTCRSLRRPRPPPSTCPCSLSPLLRLTRSWPAADDSLRPPLTPAHGLTAGRTSSALRRQPPTLIDLQLHHIPRTPSLCCRPCFRRSHAAPQPAKQRELSRLVRRPRTLGKNDSEDGGAGTRRWPDRGRSREARGRGRRRRV